MEYNPFSHALQANPYPVYRWLRDESPVHHNAKIGFYALSRYEDVLAAHLDPRRFSNLHGTTIENISEGMDTLLQKDPPEHTWHRRIVARVFSPKRTADLEPLVRRATVELLDALEGRREFDVVADFSAKLPMSVISEILAIPVELRDKVHDYSNRILIRDPGDEQPVMTGDAMLAAFEYFQMFVEMAEERRKHPQDGVFDLMIQSEIVDDAGNRSFLTNEQLASRFLELAVAGHETVMKLIASGVVALAANPDQRRELANDPSLLPNAVEEMLRCEPPSHYQGRWTTCDVELHGTTIPADQRVLLVTAAATHDDRVYRDPERFDIRREIGRQLGFGFGDHVCLGAPLARLETRVAFEELLRRYPTYEIVEDGVVRAYGTNVQGLKRLPVRLPQSAA